MEITVRAALLQEKDAIYHLYEQAMRNHIETIWGWNQSWQENDFDNAFQASQAYIIESESILLGYFQIDPNEDHDYLRMLILKPEARSLGIGAKVLAKILEITHDSGKALMLRVFKVNVDAKRFYEREGWMVMAEEEAFFLMGHPSSAITRQPNNSFQRTAKGYAFGGPLNSNVGHLSEAFMHRTDYFQLMAKYNRWMNLKILAVCEEIPEHDRRKDLGAFFKSIHETLDHIYYGDTAWMDRFCGRPVSVNIGEQLNPTFKSLKAARQELDNAIVEWAQYLNDAWLAEDFEYFSNVDGKTRILPAWILVTHMFNHQTHHRGQVTTLMKQLGYEPGITDIPWLPELDAVVD